MGISIPTYAISKSYTDNSIKGIAGVLAGKNCTIEKIDEFEDHSVIHFKWEADDGTVKRRQLAVQNGVGIEDIKIEDKHLIIYLSDGTRIDAGEFSNAKGGIWISDEHPPAGDDYLLWISPNEPEQGIPTASEEDINKLWE